MRLRIAKKIVIQECRGRSYKASTRKEAGRKCFAAWLRKSLSSQSLIKTGTGAYELSMPRLDTDCTPEDGAVFGYRRIKRVSRNELRVLYPEPRR